MTKASHREAVRFPERFRGIFERHQERFTLLIAEARDELRILDVPPIIRAQYEYAVLEHAQPSFMLLPMLYLAMADHVGGATERHRRYLPSYLLAMELVAVLDDTVDRTPCRSGRQTYPRRFGARSATPFCSFMLNTILVQTADRAPEILPLVTGLFHTLCALQTWEYHARYPDPTPEGCARWLQHHYDAVTPAVAHSLDSALRLHGLTPLPHEVCTRFGEIMQDVDDVVNLVEQREQNGENDDLKMGIVTHPLLSALRVDRRAHHLTTALWQRYRQAGDAAREDFESSMARCHEETRAEFRALRELLILRGVPATTRKIAADADACVAAAPAELRPCVGEMVQSFVNRLDRQRPGHEGGAERTRSGVMRLGSRRDAGGSR